MASDTEGSFPKSNEWDLYASEVNGNLCPVGAIIAWAKDLTGCRSIPNTFVECNGQTLNDSDSVYDGVVMPNLNGTTEATKRYLRSKFSSLFLSGRATLASWQFPA